MNDGLTASEILRNAYVVTGGGARLRQFRAAGEHDQSMADPEHYGRLGYVCKNFDSCKPLKDQNGKQVFSTDYRDRNNKPAPVVELKMKVDGTVAVQQAVPDSKWKRLRIVSVHIEKSAPGGAVHQP